MKRRIEKVAVLGAGVMGTGIAAHLAGTGLDVLMLDIVPKDAPKDDRKARNAVAAGALKAALKGRPAPFHDPEDARRIEIGNLEDDLGRIAECDWVVEVVKEDLGIKQALFERVDAVRKPGTPVTSNTSGLKIADMAAGRSDDFRKHFFVTHFFNPVRYMRLLEMVAGEETDPALFAFFQRFGEDVLGKGVVVGRDTPNFVANRIGVFSMMHTMRVMEEMEMSVEAVDAIVGKPMGRPKSAAFRTADLVGLDTFCHVAGNCYENLPADEARETFKVPEWLEYLVGMGWLGNKTKKGIYEKTKEGLMAFDWKRRTYAALEKPKFEALAAAKKQEDVGERVKVLVNHDDPAGRFAWRVLAPTLAYSARRVGEIADDLVNIDRGMRWGFNWDLGPFEAWDAIGVRESTERMKADGIDVPEWVEKFLAEGHDRFYERRDGVMQAWHPIHGRYEALEPRPGFLFLDDVKATTKPIFENTGATVLDLGDGVACVEFHTKMNALDQDILEAVAKGLDWAENEGVGLVLGNESATAFSAGANLFFIYMMAQKKDWDGIDRTSKAFQDLNLRLRYSRVPVVAAPHGLALGGGCEMAMHADVMQAHAELYMGLVEVGVGLIPGAGGTKEMALRFGNALPKNVDTMKEPFLQRAFENIAMARVSTGAKDARNLGFLRAWDGITFNLDRRLADAKRRVLAMNDLGYAPPLPMQAVLPGRNGATVFEYALDDFKHRGLASEHDVLIGTKVARVLCGGDTDGRTPVSEQTLLDLEREAFLSLCGEEKTQARIEHMLKTNKPLRN